jgi:Secretion system C-terminal sorting domain
MKNLLSFICCCLFLATVSAQNLDTINCAKTYKIPNNNGSPFQYYSKIFFDANNNKYVLDPVFGFQKFDGTTWTSYKVPTTKDIYISSCVQDNQNNIWFLVDIQLYKFDGANFTVFNLPKPLSNTASFINSNALAVAGTTLWIYDDILNTAFSFKNGVFKQEKKLPQGVQSGPPVTAPNKEKVYFVTQDSIYIFNSNGLLKQIPLDNNIGFLTNIVADDNENLYGVEALFQVVKVTNGVVQPLNVVFPSGFSTFSGIRNNTLYAGFNIEVDLLTLNVKSKPSPAGYEYLTPYFDKNDKKWFINNKQEIGFLETYADKLTISASQLTFCNNETVTLTASSGFSQYYWNTGETTPTITINFGNFYYLTAKKNNAAECDRDFSAIIEVKQAQPDPQQFCNVAVNPQTGKNVLVWQPLASNNIAKYNIYRETDETQQYEKIGEVNYNPNQGIFEDPTANPNVRAFVYIMEVVDSCGNSAETSYAVSVHLAVNINANRVNLQWTPFTAGDNFIKSYEIYRGKNVNDMALLQKVSGSVTAFTDLTPDETKRFYMIKAIPQNVCTTGQGNKIAQFPTSNIIFTGEKLTPEALTIFPNPVGNEVNISFLQPIEKLEILDINGRVVESTTPATNTNWLTMDTKNIQNGIYLVKIWSGGEIFTKKIIK